MYNPGTLARWVTWFDLLSPSNDLSDGWDHHLHITDGQTEVLKAGAPGAVTVSAAGLGHTLPVASVDPPRHPKGWLPTFCR